jgi:SRSO17 transposase
MVTTCPEIELTLPEIAGLIDELDSYHSIFSPLFRLLLDIPRKSIEPMVIELQGRADGNAIRAKQQFVGQGGWADAAILSRHWQEVDVSLGEADGVIIMDGSDFPKQGNDSVGVKRQYCGQLGCGWFVYAGRMAL